MDISKEKLVSYISLLMIICICAFLVAKYLVRLHIDDDEIPVDISEKM